MCKVPTKHVIYNDDNRPQAFALAAHGVRGLRNWSTCAINRKLFRQPRVSKIFVLPLFASASSKILIVSLMRKDVGIDWVLEPKNCVYLYTCFPRLLPLQWSSLTCKSYSRVERFYDSCPAVFRGLMRNIGGSEQTAWREMCWLKLLVDFLNISRVVGEKPTNRETLERWKEDCTRLPCLLLSADEILFGKQVL